MRAYRRSGTSRRVTWTELDVPDAPPMPVYEAAPDHDRSGATIVVLHELFGVTDDIRGIADDLAAAGHRALAPQLYHRTAAAGEQYPRNDAGRASAFAQLHQLNRDQAVDSIRAALAVADDPDRVGLLGFSMGGHVAYLAACRLPVRETVAMYPGWLTGTDVPLTQPTPTVELTPGITGAITICVGSGDRLIDSEQVEAVRIALAAADVPHRIEVLPNAPHAFFWPGTPEYDPAARARSWSLAVEAFARL